MLPSPRSAARRCASFAFGDGGEGNISQALARVREVLDKGQPAGLAASKIIANVRSALVELGALEKDRMADEGAGAAEAPPPPLVGPVRAPVASPTLLVLPPPESVSLRCRFAGGGHPTYCHR